MFDLAELAYLETDDDRVAHRQAHADRVFPSSTDDEARALLEKILAWRRAGLAAERPYEAALLIQEDMARLAAGVGLSVGRT